MNGVGIAAVVAVVVALRLWLRRRRRGIGGVRIGIGSGPSANPVGLVAAREVRERVRGRIFRVGTVLILAVVAIAIAVPASKSGTSHPHQTVGVVGPLSQSLRATVVASGASHGIIVRLEPEANAEAARGDLRSGRIDLAIVEGRTILVKKAFSSTDTSTTAQLTRTVSDNLAVARAVEAAGLSAAQFAKLAGARPLPVTSIESGTTTGTTHSTSLLGLILVFLMLTQYNTWTLMGVMEEKSSRVAEVLLSALRPVQLLTGKVLGIGLVAFVQATLIAVFALGFGRIVGSDLLKGAAPLVLASTVVWLVLGYAFYCWVYAAAGSMAERQDQVQSLAVPLSLPLLFGYITALTALSAGSASTLVRVLAYIPPTAPFAMPVLVGLRAVTWWEFGASALLSIVCTIAVARFAARIYRRAILRTGRRVHLREVVARTTR